MPVLELPLVHALDFTTWMAPVGKQRARTVRVGNFSRTYTPEKTVSAEAEVRLAFALSHPDHKAWESGPVAITIRAFMPAPKTMLETKWKRPYVEAEVWPVTTKPDADNILKLVKDALNKLAWRDDSQVTPGPVLRYYSLRPRLEVEIEFYNQITKEWAC